MLRRESVNKSYNGVVRLVALANHFIPDDRPRPANYTKKLKALARRAFGDFEVGDGAICGADLIALGCKNPPDWVAQRAANVAREVLDAFANGRHRVQFPPAFPPMLALDANGVIRPVSDLVDAITSILTGKAATRIRRCPVCAALFVAQRIDRSACSTRCTTVLNVRRFRERQARYEINRQKNRAAKAARAQLRRAKEN